MYMHENVSLRMNGLTQGLILTQIKENLKMGC